VKTEAALADVEVREVSVGIRLKRRIYDDNLRILPNGVGDPDRIGARERRRGQTEIRR